MTPRATMFARAVRLRCPNCGGGRIIRRWFGAPNDCPHCGISLIRGNRVGAYIVNLVVAELLGMAVVLTLVVRGWPEPPWELLGWLAPALAIGSPLLFYPFAKILFVAVDLAVHPGGRRDEDRNAREARGERRDGPKVAR